MITAAISRLVILFFGTLYPAYASYKAMRTKSVKDYVKWMMYWIVFAFFTCIETFTDIFLSWLPFYYEIKVVIVFWLLSPATKGSSTLYRKFVHPMLTRREQEIDEYLNQAKERGYSAVLQLGTKGVNYATNVIMQTAIKGGGNLVQTIKRSYSLSDLSEPDSQRTQDEIDEVLSMRTIQPRLLRQRQLTAVGRSASSTRHSTGMYFTEVDVASKETVGDFSYIRSTEDISSGYSSTELVSTGGGAGGGLSRTTSMNYATRTRGKAKRNEYSVDFDIIESEPAALEELENNESESEASTEDEHDRSEQDFKDCELINDADANVNTEIVTLNEFNDDCQKLCEFEAPVDVENNTHEVLEIVDFAAEETQENVPEPDDKAHTPRMHAQHNKGKAPEPPTLIATAMKLPESSSSANNGNNGSGSGSSGGGGISNFLKSIKSSVLRKSADKLLLSDELKEPNKQYNNIGKETAI